MALPANTPINTLLHYTVSISTTGSDCNLNNNIFTWSDIVTNSYDPNDKTLLNPQDAAGNILNDDAPLHYQIRFQNTGTDTAYTVVVRDTVDLTYLDKTSFKIIGASHNMQTRWEGANILVFSFPNIYLVDSFHNEPKSHGWLQFSILRKPNTPLYSSVNNTAAIVFDYNDAVITNTVSTQFVPFLAVNTLHEPLPELTIQPNPTTDNVRITTDQTQYTLTLTDILGRVLYTNVQRLSAGVATQDLSLTNLPAATYFITIKNEKGSVTRKVVKM